MKQVTYLDSKEMRKEVLDAIRAMSTLVGKTLGPGGRPILLEQEVRPPLSTKDGVTVARHFAASSPIQKVVAEAAREVCERTVRQVGDGTTTAIVLASAIVEAGQEWLQANPGYSPQRLARELKELFLGTIKPMILERAKKIQDLDFEAAQAAIRHVAMVSANHDEEIANAVAEAVKYSGEDGMVTVEEGAGAETRVDHKDGYPIGSGLADLGGAAQAAFVNRKSFGDCVLSGAYIALYDGDINDVETVLPLMERVLKETDGKGMPARHPIVIVAHRFGDQVLKVFAQNFRQQTLSIVPLTTPRSGQAFGRQSFLFDLAAYLNTQVFDSQGNPFPRAHPPMLGFAEEIKIQSNESVILTDPDAELVERRIIELKEQMDGLSAFDQDLIRYRIGQLTGGVATIYAGGATALEAKERHARVVDAVSAVRSAMDLGVVPGGGATLLHISRSLPTEGVAQILTKALKRPFIQILLNAGVAATEEEAILLGDKVGQAEDGRFLVFDALRRTTSEWWESGIIDPAKVEVSALENSLSVAQLLMTLGGVVAASFSQDEQNIKAMQQGLMKAMNNGELE